MIGHLPSVGLMWSTRDMRARASASLPAGAEFFKQNQGKTAVER
jgi:hypothetical protein